jgi:uncharacterized repeat protein (TIGR01451 family)
MKSKLFRSLVIPAIGIALTLFLTPLAALADTAAGTKITNTASVTWSGAAIPVSASADVTVLLKATAPNVAYVSTSPSSTVGAGSDISITYTVTSTANGADTYNLDLASVQSSGNLGAPTFDSANPVTVSLGASMALSSVTNSSTLVIPGQAGDHGLTAGDTVVIGGGTYTISNVSSNGANTTLTLSGNVTMAAGDPIYEWMTLKFDMTTGLFTGGSNDETHALTLTATSSADPSKSGLATNPTITVARSNLSISKTADKASAKPGDPITYTITVENKGAFTAANVTVTDATPAFTTYVPGSGSYSVNGGSPNAIGDGALAAGLNIGNLAGGSTVAISFQARVD